jgi:Outer membrane protein beta-barrel domain
MHFAIRSAVIACLLMPSLATAQNRVIELGIDGAISRTTQDVPGVDVSATNVNIPVSSFRLGFLTANRVLSVEPALAAFRSATDNATFTNLQLDLGLLYHFRTDALRAQPYLRPFAGLERTSFSTDEPDASDSRTHTRIGGALGIKLPIMNRLAGRLEGRFAHGFESDDVGATNEYALVFGLSFFTR